MKQGDWIISHGYKMQYYIWISNGTKGKLISSAVRCLYDERALSSQQPTVHSEKSPVFRDIPSSDTRPYL